MVDDCQFSTAVDDERSSRPIGMLDVERADETFWPQYGTGDRGNYAQIVGESSAPSAPPLPVAKMQAMNIE